MKVRIKFAKFGTLRFIGHLDVMRFFQKAMRRADVDIKYTTGFSPHQIMSFAQPLGLGITSEGEYVDIEVDTTMDSKTMVDRLNAVMVEGLKILSFRQLDDSAKNGMSVIAGADYYVSFKEEKPCPFDLPDAWSRFLSQDEILVEKQTKTKTEVIDLKPMIFDAEAQSQSITLEISCGSSQNLKPEVVIDALYRFMGFELDMTSLRIHRIELYAREENGQLVSLEDMGQEID